jgi:hypothetical protein
MNELISKLYQKNIIKIKNISLNNGNISPIFIDFFKIFEDKQILNLFLYQINNFITENIEFDHIIGNENMSKNICTLLYYKFNISNIFSDDDYYQNILLIKENYGISSNNLTKIKNRKNKINSVFFLIKYGNTKNIDIKNYYFFDSIYILSILYQKNIIDYEKYTDLFKLIYPNTIKEKKINQLSLKNNRIIFDTSIIEKLDIKDFVKTLNYLCPHISLIKINLQKFGSNLSSIIKLLIHHNIVIIDKFNEIIIKILKEIYDKNNKNILDYIINIIYIDELLTINNINFNSIIVDNINMIEFLPTKLKLLNIYKQNKNIVGFITNDNDYIFENKLKIGYYIPEETLEQKIFEYNYDVIISNNPQNIINLKQLINNIIMR